MSGPSEPTPRRVYIASVTLGYYAVLGGLFSFAGWAADLPRLTDWIGDGISIQPNATIAATLSGCALLLLASGHRFIAALSGVTVAAIGGSVLYQYLSGTDLQIDTLLLFGREWGQTGVLSPGRMGPPGAVSWTLIGIAIVIASLFRMQGSRPRAVVPLLASLTSAIASLSLIGYLYGA
ncbi:MAG TPA: hypothetical protein VFS23_27045, partial [Vicinamibacterales bacterium]|nr:hypothetical protein [Vicinamibacterales bacterium]